MSKGLLTILTCSLMGWLSGCGGVIDDWRERSATFQKLVSPEAPSATTSDTSSDKTDAQTATNINFVTVSRCNASEYDLIVKTLTAFRNPGTGQFDRDFIVTLETPAVTLGHAVVDTTEIVSNAQMATADLARRTIFPMTVHVPWQLANGEEFTAYLFACVDLDQDNSCTNEATAPMEGFNFKSDVVYFLPVKVRAGDGQVSFRRLTDKEQADPPRTTEDGAAKEMQSLLNNLKAAPELVGDNPLSVVITVTKPCYSSGPAPAPAPSPRTDGCFIEGTRVASVGLDTLPVEEIYPGTALLTSAGALTRTLKHVAGPERHPVIEIVTEAGHRLAVTRFHPMMTTRGLKVATALRTADRLITAAGAPVRIASLRRRAYAGLVYNFELPGGSDEEHLIIAEGLVTGDLHLQQRLSRELRGKGR